MNQTKPFNEIEIKILRTTHKWKINVTAYELSIHIHHTYQTTKKYAEKLAQKNWIIKTTKTRKDGKTITKYKFNYEALETRATVGN